MHFQISSDFLVGRVLSKRHFFDFDYSKEIAGTLPVNNPTFGSHRTASPRGARARRPGARVRRAGASGRCHVALPTGRTRGGIPVRCRRRAFSQQRISGRVRRRLPRADMSGTRLAGRQVSGTRCRHRADDMQFPCQPAQASETSTSRRRRTGGPRGDARRGPDGGAESGPRRTIPHHRRPGAPALFLLCAQRAQHIRRQSSGARARAVRAHPCCTCAQISGWALRHSD